MPGSERETRPPPEDMEKKKMAPGGSSAPPLEVTDLAAKRVFVRAVVADAKAYTDTTVEETMEEYRRVGKLHRYNPDNEWMKRVARIARKHPPPEGFVPEVQDFLRLLEEDEAS
ncbi:unnamed protein product [Urochloa humidicola]